MNVDFGYGAAIMGSVILLVGASVIINAAIQAWLVTYQLRQCGVVATATVSSLRWEPSGRAASHYVTFEFRVSNKGHHVTAEQQITAKHFGQLIRGRQVQIRYVPANPQLARLTGADTDNAINNTGSIIAILIMLLFPPFIVVTILLFLYRAKKIPI